MCYGKTLGGGLPIGKGLLLAFGCWPLAVGLGFFMTAEEWSVGRRT